MISSQMLKGTLEGCILGIISRKEQLGSYGFGKITEGTIYPILLRLEKNGMITATYRQSDMGPKRKYYSLTAEGMEEFHHFVSGYNELSNAVSCLLQDTLGGERYEKK